MIDHDEINYNLLIFSLLLQFALIGPFFTIYICQTYNLIVINYNYNDFNYFDRMFFSLFIIYYFLVIVISLVVF
jgi:hypothetical protein